MPRLLSTPFLLKNISNISTKEIREHVYLFRVNLFIFNFAGRRTRQELDHHQFTKDDSSIHTAEKNRAVQYYS